MEVQYIGRDEVYIRGFKGEFNRSIYEDMYRHYKDKGIRKIRYRHKKKDHVID